MISCIVNINYYDIKKCIKESNLYDRSKIYGNIVIHNLITCFLFLGLFVFDTKIITFHIILISIIIIHWKTNDNKCIVTVDLNRRCKLDEDEKHRDIFYYIRNINNKNKYEIEKRRDIEKYIFMITYIIISIFKILYIKKREISMK